MSRSYSGNDIVLLSYQGHNLNVYIEYQVDVDDNYGADADGNRGVRHEEVDITDKWIRQPFYKHFTQEETDEILSLAEKEFLTRHGWNQS